MSPEHEYENYEAPVPKTLQSNMTFGGKNDDRATFISVSSITLLIL